ncbi:MAG: carbohydrate-binding protein [Phycisphaeraceae bacterium]|nr:carbohydrate-binding protein [Phycisphaeraceae bacterium]
MLRPSFVIALSLASPLSLAQPITPAGSGSYYDGVPSGYAVPTNGDGAPCLPRLAPGFTGPVPTNEWWSSLVYPRHGGDNWGQNMHPHPLSARPASDGMRIGYVPSASVASNFYSYDFSGSRVALALSVDGLDSPDCRLAAAGDWTVTARFADATRSLEVTMGHGMPFAYCKVTGGNARVIFRTSTTVFANRGNIIGITAGGVSYALCAPAGAAWTISGSGAISSLAGKDYYSVAVLPDASTASLDLAEQHAFVFITGSEVSWNYNQATSAIDTTFVFQTEVKEGAQTQPLIALYRHQWINSAQPTVGGTFNTSRGSMKQAAASSFVCSFPYRGILPRLPLATGLNQTQLYSLVNQAYQATSLNTAGDTYYSGKSYGRVAQLLYIADAVGHTAAKTRFLDFLKAELADWFTAGVTSNPNNSSAFNPIQAEDFTDGSGVAVGDIEGGKALIDMSGTDWFKLSAVDFGSGDPNGMTIRYASDIPGSGLLQVRVDAIDGPLLSDAGIGNTGGINAWTTINLNVQGAGVSALAANNRVHDLYISCNTPYPGELIRIDWLKFNLAGSSGGSDSRNFYYHSAWSTLLGNPGSFNLAQEMNDHNFHYGYFIMAAAAIAQFDPAWASAYGPMVEMLIRDASNWERADTRFPFLRGFDPYASHSWASGHAAFAAGNNQESSSESMNFAAAVALWGAATGNTAIRDMGMFLHAAEEAAIQQYWFNADDAAMPPSFTKPIAGIVWGDGVAYGTWWTGDPAQIHGINFLPVTPASLYLGHHRQGMLDNWSLLMAQTNNNPSSWHSILWSALATANPTQAANLANGNPNFPLEDGDSRARAYQWIHTLNIYGAVDASISADVPHYAVFEKSGIRTYVAWNPGDHTIGVHFSDGFVLCVPSGATAVGKTGDAPGVCGCSGDLNDDNLVDDADFVVFAAAYNLLDCADPEMPAGCPADLNTDSQVDDADFVMFVAAYNLLICP